MADVLLRDPSTTDRRATTVRALVTAAVLLLTLTGVARLIELPARVDRVAVQNPIAYDVNVRVSGDATGGWLAIGTVDREETRSFDEVLDQGDSWTFRFSYAGLDAGELRVSRADLAAQGWRLSVPSEVATRLQQVGIQPSA